MMGLLRMLLCCGLATVACARDWQGVDAAHLRGVVIPLYNKQDRTSVANVRIGCVFPDYERRGFFRVGLLPMVAGESVQIEVLQGRRALNALTGLEKRFTTQQRRVVEWRDVTFTFAHDSALGMHVGRLRMVSEEQWELLDGVRIQCGTETTWPKASLFLSGPNAGQVRYGSASIELFKREPRVP